MKESKNLEASEVLELGFRLGDISIDPRAGEVAGPGGTEKLDPKVMDVLAMLARHAGHVVLREDLLAQLWPGVVVTDDALTRCVHELRRQLSLAGGSERYRALVETLPKRGYRLNGEVALPRPQPASQLQEDPRRSRQLRQWLAVGAFLAAAGLGVVIWSVRDQRNLAVPPASTPPAQSTVKSIAVLPFLDLSEGRDQQYFSDGIAEEILDRLANNEGQIRVIARTSSFSFRDRPVDIPEIAAKLNVSHILEGSVRRSGDRIRLTAQLVTGADGTHLWSETYDRRVGDLFAVQDDIATSVTSALQAALTGDGTKGGKPTNAAAYDDYLHGKFLFERRAPGDIERSVRNFESAVARDPGYARAWAALSAAYSLMWWDAGLDPAVWRPKQGEAALKAVEVDPELVEARTRLARYYFDTSQWKRAVEQLKTAAALDPDDRRLARFRDDLTVWHDVDFEGEIAEYRVGLKDDPHSAVRHSNLGLLLFAAGHFDEALAELRKVQELNPDAGWDIKLEIGRVLVPQKRYDEARAVIMELPAGARDYGIALLHQAPGMRDPSDAALARLQRRSGDRMHSIRIAEALCLRGEHDEAFATLRRGRDALERDEAILSRLWTFQHELRTSPFLVPLHRDLRWRALIAKPEGDSAQEIIERLWPASKTAAVTE